MSAPHASSDSLSALPAQRLSPDDRLNDLLPADWAAPLTAAELETLEDLYECAASLGATWYRNFPGLGPKRARALMEWLAQYGKAIGEVTARFMPPTSKSTGVTKSTSPSVVASKPEPIADDEIVPLERLDPPEHLRGQHGVNRAPAFACSLSAQDDLEAIRTWLNARAGNPNTFGNYRKEAERFLLWCLVEKQSALSDIRADAAAQYLHWLEDLGRIDEATFARRWRVKENRWIGPKNAPRNSAGWRPFNGPLSSASRRNAVVVVRQLFNFLRRTGYLIFNPFDQVTPKVPLLRGERAPQVFADRSLTEAQWTAVIEHLSLIPEGLPRERMKLILMMGRSLGMRASEMLDARTGWIVRRYIGSAVRPAIEIVGKGSKVRRLPLTDEQLQIIDDALRARNIAGISDCPPETPLLINLGRGPKPNGPMSRSGLYRVLESFFSRVSDEVAVTAPLDAAKLRAASTHWLRHTFAVRALAVMDVNVVQTAMGHASVATTGRYLSPEEEEMSEAMSRLKAL